MSQELGDTTIQTGKSSAAGVTSTLQTSGPRLLMWGLLVWIVLVHTIYFWSFAQAYADDFLALVGTWGSR